MFTVRWRTNDGKKDQTCNFEIKNKAEDFMELLGKLSTVTDIYPPIECDD
jgi:hypothetical protein